MGDNRSILENWGSRDIHNYRNPEKVNQSDGGWGHNDFIQHDSQNIASANQVSRGNVTMLRSMLGGTGMWLPYQGRFSSKSTGTNWIDERNIIIGMSPNAITLEFGSGTRERNNTVLRLIDYENIADFDEAQIKPVGVVEAVNNVTCGKGTGAAYGTNGLRIQVGRTAASRATILTYYEGAHRASTFYGARPKVGAITHWSYGGGTPTGAAEQYRRVIVDKLGFPKLGAGFAAWKRQYDSANEIMAAA